MPYTKEYLFSVWYLAKTGGKISLTEFDLIIVKLYMESHFWPQLCNTGLSYEKWSSTLYHTEVVLMENFKKASNNKDSVILSVYDTFLIYCILKVHASFDYKTIFLSHLGYYLIINNLGSDTLAYDNYMWRNFIYYKNVVNINCGNMTSL